MKKKFLIECLGCLALSGLIPLIATSCATQYDYVFALSSTLNSGSYKEFVQDIQDEFNKLRAEKATTDKTYANMSDITIGVVNLDDNQSKMDALENGSVDFAFLTSKSLVDDNFYQKVNAQIQTLTTAFTFDTDTSQVYNASAYGTDCNPETDDPLRVIASEMQNDSFGNNYQYPLSSWQDTSGNPPNYDWNGVRYNAFYDTDVAPINGYRGMILLSGTDAQISKAKTAWDQENWDDFRNCGIIVGDSSSAGNYLLQEQLIKQHFKLGDDWTLAQDMKANPTLYKTDTYGTSDIGKDANFVVSFTDEASFAWTHNTSSNTDYSPRNGASIQVLTVTNPLLYDIGVFAKNVDEATVTLFDEAIIDLATNGNNLYGEGLGYNGYKQISDVETDVVQPVKTALGYS